MAYQGWKNFGTWGAALILSNDEHVHSQLLNFAQSLAAQAPDREESYWTEEEFVKFNLADEIKELVEGAIEEVEAPSEFARLMASQMIMAGLSEVDWHEIAEHYMED